MRKAFKLQDLECASCAAKMESGINKIEGVNSASISFMTQRLVIDTNRPMDEVLNEAQRVCSRIEPDCVILR